MWSIISQLIPGPFETPALSEEPGTSGRVLRVTVGVATLFFTSYYQTMQLRSLFTSSTRPIEYTLSMLADDLETGNVLSLIMQSKNGTLDKELYSNPDPSFEHLRHVLEKHPIMYSENSSQSTLMTLMHRIVNESIIGNNRNFFMKNFLIL
jgi:hypothetical protein